MDAQLTLTLRYTDGKLEASWPAQEDVYGYEIAWHDTTAGSPRYLKRILAADYLAPVILETEHFQPVMGETYTADVWIIGPPSQPQRVVAFDAASILQALLHLLLGNRPAPDEVALNSTTLPAGQPGSPDAILALIQQTLKVDELVITTSADPALNEEQTLLTIDGMATLLNAEATPVHFAFTVSEDMLLQMVMTADLLEAWTFSDSFPNKNLGMMSLWETSARQFWLTSYAYSEDNVFFPLAIGLNLLGTLSLSSDLMPTTTEGAIVQAVRFGGGIDNHDDTLTFHWTGSQTLDDLSLQPLEWSAMTLTGGTLLLDSVPGQDEENPGNLNNFRIEGTIALAYGTLPFALGIPTNPVSPVIAITRPQDASFESLGGLIGDIPGTVLPSYLPVSLSGLGPISLLDMIIVFDPAQLGATRSTLEVGTTAAWTLSIFSLESPRIAIDSTITPDPFGSNFRTDQLALKATVMVNSAPFDVAMFIPPYGDWTLRVINAQPDLDGIAALMGTTASAIISALPAPLQNMGIFVPTQVEIAFNPFTPSFNSIAFNILQIQPWVIVEDLLVVTNWSIDMGYWWNNGDWTLSSVFEGDIVIAGLSVHMRLPIPSGQEGWTLSFAQEPINIPGFGDLLRLIGAEDTADLLPQGVQDLGSLTILRLDINLDLNNLTNPVRRLIFQIYTPSPWQLLPAQGLILEKLDMGINVVLSGETNTYVATGYIRGILSVLGTEVYLQTQRTSASAPWLLLLSTARIIHVPGIADLAAWMLPDNVLVYIPVSFMPFSAGLDINTFNLEFDLTNTNLNLISFFIRNSEAWGIIPDYITLDNVFVDSTITNPLADSPGLVARIQGLLTLGTLPVTLSANKATVDAEWVFNGTITPGSVIDFEAIFDEYVPSISMPYDYGFPRSVTIVEGSATIIPATSKFQFALSTLFDWQFNMGFTILSINALSASLDVEAPGQGGVRPYVFNASGAFTFVGIYTQLTFTTSNGTTDTVIVGIASNTPAAINLPSVSNQLLTDGNTGTETWSGILSHVPVGFADFGELTITVGLNLTKNLFLLYGYSENFGSIAYMMQQLEDGTWGYFVSVKLADGFTFESLLPALSVIDGILTFENGSASFAYSSYDVSSAQALTSIIPQFASAFSLTNSGVPTPIRPGVNFYAALNFGSETRSLLFSNVVVMLSGVDDKPDLVLYGYIGNQTADDGTNSTLNTLFRATLGDFVVLDILRFNGVTFQFEMAQNTVISLYGDMVLTLYTGQQNQQAYSFHGNLSISDTEANFSIVQTQPPAPSQSMVDPMGMTGVTLGDLRLIFQYIYATSAVTLEMGGSVYYGTGDSLVTLSGVLALVNNSPALVEMTLSVTPQLGIIAFVVQSVTNITYPPEYFDFYFISGSVYYYDAAADINQTYKRTILPGETPIIHVDGFNIQSKFSMFSRSLSIELHVASNGFTATGKMLDPFDLGFVTFTDFDFTGSPSLFIRVLTNDEAFGLRLGFIFFDEHFATGEVSIVLEDGETNVPQMRARFTYAGDIAMFVGSSIAFTYDEENGFQVTDWPFDFLYLLDYAALMDGFEMPGCGELVNMVFDNVVKTKFIVNPKFSLDGAALVITLTGAYTITLIGQDAPFLVVGMPDLPIYIDAPSSFTLSALPDMIFRSIADSAQAIVDSLLNDPLKLGIFLTTVGVSKVAPGVIADIACYSGEAEESAELIEAAEGLQETAEAAVEAADIAFDAFELAVEAGEILAAAEALADLLAAGAAVAVASAGILEIAADVGAGLVVAGAVVVVLGAAAYITYKIGEALFGDDGDPVDPPEQDAPELEKAHISNLTYEAGKIIVSWQAVRNAQAYRITLSKGGNDITYTIAESTRLTVSFSTDDLSAGTYSVKVAASAGGYKGSTSNNSTIDMLDTPTVHLTINSDTVVATWNTISSAARYIVHWTKDGQDIKTEHVSSATSSVPMQGQGTYTAQVLADGDLYHIPSAWSQPASLNVTGLSAPANIHVTYNAATQAIDVAWDAVSGATGYAVQLVKNGAPYDDAQSGAVTHASFAVNNLTPAVYQAQVMATSSTVSVLSSGWDTSSEQVQILAAPAIEAIVYADGVVTVTLSAAVDGAAGYLAQFADEIGNGIGDSVPNVDLTLTLPDSLVPIGTYHIRVQSTVADVAHAVASDWITSAQAVLTLGVPTITTASYQAENLRLAWTDVPGATAYTIEVRAADGRVALTAQTLATVGENPEPAPTTLILDITGLAVDTPYTVVVQAIDADGSSAWSEAIRLVLLDAPTNIHVMYNAATQTIDVQWDAVIDATGYAVQLVKDGVPYGDPQIDAVTLYSFAMTGLTPAVYQAQVQATSSDNGVLSDDWTLSLEQVQILAAPAIEAIVYADGVVTVTLSAAVDGAAGYLAQFADELGNGIGDSVPNVDLTLTLPDSLVPIGTYHIRVQSTVADVAHAVASDWTVSSQSVEIVAPPVETPESLAQQLHDAGDTAQQAAPILIAQFPTELADASAMIALLTAYFPESTKTLTQIAWALAVAGYSNSDAMTALNAAYPGRIADVSAAIKAAYPVPSVLEQVQVLQSRGATAQTATAPLRAVHTDLTALEMAVLLMMQFAASVPDPTSMAQALLNAFYIATDATEAVTETFPLSSIADIAAAINAVYPTNPTAMAQYIHGLPRIAQAGAPFIKVSFSSTFNADAVGMINLLTPNFPESTKTLTQVAWALGEARYSDTDAMSALNTVYPGRLADVSAAIKAAYPAPSVKQTIAELHTQPDVNAIVAATKLHAVYPDLTALQMAVMLRMYFLPFTQTPIEVAQALEMALYSADDATEALYETYPLSSIADIAAAINAVYIVP